MIIFPAIDIIDGKCVRLKQGKFDDVTVFSDKPSLIARQWEDAGASFLHIVDLDGAKEGSSFNNGCIKEILGEINIPIQVGGGIRSINDIKEKINLGVSRVILGTAAIKEPGLVKEASRLFGDKIAVGIDAKNGYVAINGWQEISGKTAVDLCFELKGMGIKTVIYTDISKDGMMQGPNIETTKELIEKSGLNIIASGGISSYNDLVNVSKINAYGAIIGKALYEGSIDLKKAILDYEVN
ncbi:MAG: 1-(5-phosphoribosyl)-5-[(5-phosphoribosylamino)methylideneamino]imidazole-4-carboxamide isomerase [Clostridiales bacterium]|jgi:phosphoribosylformimino-5-aminoimidazole carboxamide ribotide isomerase|nr:1-(5-phosphoribosyl)-5-[(5-phosphoribosylamino)methylideneamino]imidazole-4-carboxamide isomerase [Clostridiales bacterium]